MRPYAAATLLVLLAACQPQAPDGAPAAPPADAPPPTTAAPAAPGLPADLAGDLEAVGTEPFWAAKVTGGAITLARPDEAEVTAPLAAPVMEGQRAVWTQQAQGKALVLSVWKAACSDGMSDRSFPLTATLKLGELTLNGCAAKAGETPKNR